MEGMQKFNYKRLTVLKAFTNITIKTNSHSSAIIHVIRDETVTFLCL